VCAQQVKESTHDWTATTGGPGLREGWADVKTPGDGRTYSVGTITVQDTTGTPLFSEKPISRPTGVLGFNIAPASRQVIVVQCVSEAAPDAIAWQRFFYGETQSSLFRATNARAISVWPEANPLDTRVAICGETYDTTLPLSQASPAASTATDSTGFVAVFDGNGNLLWTHHLFGGVATESCAVTDVAIRREGNPGALRDVVTFCGISSHGNPASLVGTPLQPLNFHPSYGPYVSAGNVDNGAGQWDGFVGRVHHRFNNPNDEHETDFHSIISGPGQDGLFGLAEVLGELFVVVGNTVQPTSSQPPNQTGFPGRSTALASQPGPHSLAAVLAFDASGTRPGGPLQIADDWYLGNTLGTPLQHSVARDVVVGWKGAPSPIAFNVASDAIFVVGETMDPMALTVGSGWPSLNFLLGSRQGPTDGFLVEYEVRYSPTLIGPLGGAYIGGPGHDGLTGVSSWNEFAEHFTVAGYTDSVATGTDVLVRSLYIDNNPTPPSLVSIIRELRGDVVLANGFERPAAMGPVNATQPASGLLYDLGIVGDPAGGGVAVDPRGRVTVVGIADGSSYPVEPPVPIGRARDPGAAADAVRTEWDLLPLVTGRTDRTGEVTAGGAPGFPVAAPMGGTTPACALSPFGSRIVATPLAGGAWTSSVVFPEVMRMLIDYEGDDALFGPVTNAAIVVSRPTPQVGSVPVGVLQLGVPQSTPLPLLGNTEAWVTGGAFSLWPVVLPPNTVYRMPLTPAPVGWPPQYLTAQLFCSLVTPVGAAACPVTSGFTASPAMWFFYQ
jgi:hypothetical protein